MHPLLRTALASLAGCLLAATADAQITRILDATGDGVNAIDFPQAIAIAPDGTLYVSDDYADTIYRVRYRGGG